MFLFIVEERFVITGSGLVLLPGLGSNEAKICDKINIIRPDSTMFETEIKGIWYKELHPILIGNHLTKQDVPIGSEVWLIESLF